MFVEELFVPVEFWERYEVSNYGRVLDVDTGTDLIQKVDRTNGRLKVRFYIQFAHKDIYVDELVANAFFVNYRTGVKIYYKNQNKLDCTVLNLSFDPRYDEVGT